MKKVGIFAGSFDPVHNGHMAFAELALKSGIDKIYFLVEPRPRRKQGVKAFEHRLEMTKLATASSPKFGVIQLEQAKFTPHTTMPLLQARFKGSQLVLLFGDDVVSYMVDHLADWPHIADLANSASLLIATRHHDQDALSDKLRSVMDFGVHFRYQFVEPNELIASSSEVRLALKRGEKTEVLLPEVQKYIDKNNIYSPLK